MVKQEVKAEIVIEENSGLAGRDADGRFAAGNTLGVGVVHSQAMSRVGLLKRALSDAVTAKDITAIGHKLVKLARRGDIAAAKELFDRLFGKAPQAIDLRDHGDNPLVTLLIQIGEQHIKLPRAIDAEFSTDDGRDVAGLGGQGLAAEQSIHNNGR